MHTSFSHIKKLDGIPERQRVTETFGWQAGIYGILFIIAACVQAVLLKRSSMNESWIVFGCMAVLGLSLTGYEIWRRRNRAVLVKDGDDILVFRKGRLDMILEPDQVTRIKADSHTMIFLGAGLGVAAVIFIAVGILLILEDQSGNADAWIILFAGLCLLASLLSAVWTRFFCCHLRIPIRGSKWTEESVLIPASRYKELFS